MIRSQTARLCRSAMWTIASALFLSGCQRDGGGGENAGDRNRLALEQALEEALVEDTAVGYGRGGVSIMVGERECRSTRPQLGRLRISGAVGDTVVLEMLCGTRPFASCTAAIARTGVRTGCDIPKTTPPQNASLFACRHSAVAGTPTIIASGCTDP